MRRFCGPVMCALVLVIGRTSMACAETSRDEQRLHPGAFEVGVSGALSVVERNATATAATRGGYFFGAGGALVNTEMEVAYGHVASLDLVETGLQIGIQPGAASGIIPYGGIGVAVRPEWIGSFRQTRVPAGIHAGVRAVVSRNAALRAEYRFHRVLRDPVANYNEHELRVGLSLLFRNGKAAQ